jgi:hypothetical protein
VPLLVLVTIGGPRISRPAYGTTPRASRWYLGEKRFRPEDLQSVLISVFRSDYKYHFVTISQRGIDYYCEVCRENPFRY